MRLSGYRKAIVEATGCAPEEAEDVEEIMRHDVFHSTLDWQTKKQFDAGARKAYKILKQSRRENAR